MAPEFEIRAHTGGWKSVDRCELPEDVLRNIQIRGRYHEVTIDNEGLIVNRLLIIGHYDSYAQVYELNGARWKIASHTSLPGGRTVCTLVYAGED